MVIKEGIAGDALGLDMYEAHRDGEELPAGVDANLSPGLEKLQELMNQMTAFQPSDRPSALNLTSRLLAVNVKVAF